MELYCEKCESYNKISLRKFRNFMSKAYCVKCNTDIKYLDAIEATKYRREYDPNWKPSTDRIGSISEVLTYGFW